MPFPERFAHWQQQADEELVGYAPVDLDTPSPADDRRTVAQDTGACPPEEDVWCLGD